MRHKLNWMSYRVWSRLARRLGPIAKACSLGIGAIACVVLLFSDVASAVSIYGVGDLDPIIYGTNRNTWYSEANAVSADGNVVVGMSRWNNATQAFSWNKDDGIIALSYWNNPLQTAAVDVSASGEWVVFNDRTDNSASHDVYLYQAGASWVKLGKVAVKSCDATAISADGSVIVGREQSDYVGSYGWIWNKSIGVMTRITEGGHPVAISGDGTILAGNTEGGQPWIWTDGEGQLLLRDLNGNMMPNSHATSISMDGTCIAGQANGQAFRWTDQDGMVGLGFLPGGTSSQALGISADGSVIVGTARDSSGVSTAFVWDALHGMRDLRDILTDSGVNLSYWSNLTKANDVSADGTVIVGNGIITRPLQVGRTEGFVATILSPNMTTVHIDFESLPGGVPEDDMEISEQYLSSKGISFWCDADQDAATPYVPMNLEQRRRELGSSGPDHHEGFLNDKQTESTNFEKYDVEGEVEDGTDDGNGHSLGNFFLRGPSGVYNDDGTHLPAIADPFTLIVQSVDPMTAFSCEIWDVDRNEHWIVEVRGMDGSVLYVNDSIFDPQDDQDLMDGKATVFDWVAQGNQLASEIRFYFDAGVEEDGKSPRVGVGFDNFKITTKAVPEPGSIALVVCGVITSLIWWRRRR